MVSERLLDVSKGLSWAARWRPSASSVPITVMRASKNRLMLSVFVTGDPVSWRNLRIIPKPTRSFLDGYICKAPIYRKTPLGREIADLLLAVNRPYGKSDYIPCIAWGRNARFASSFDRGGAGSASGDGFRAGSTRKNSARQSARREWPMRCPSASWSRTQSRQNVFPLTIFLRKI